MKEFIKVSPELANEFSDKKLFDSKRFEQTASDEIDPYRRIVVIGMGAVSPLGVGVEQMWTRIKEGEIGIRELEGDEFIHNAVRAVAKVPDFDAQSELAKVIPDNKLLGETKRRNDVSTIFAVIAAGEALGQAGILGPDGKINPDIVDPFEVVDTIGTGIGGAHTIAEASEKLHNPRPGKKIGPADIFKSLPERVSSVPSIVYGIEGGAHTPVAACATGNYGISSGADSIMLGRAKIAVVGGTDACIRPAVLGEFEAIGALSIVSDPTKASRPFDINRSGFVMGEGGGVLVLAERDFAIEKKLPIIAELAGYGEASDAKHATDPSVVGAARAARLAMRSELLKNKGPIFAAAHATGTGVGDPAELMALRLSLEGKHVAGISGPKGSLGHTMGAAGALEGILAIKALNEQIMPPTMNLEDPIAEGDGINLVPNEAQEAEVDVVINPSFGFGGLNSVTVFIRPE
jgi:3-oxoacyl-[acyl-carrier-protein] synthase II